MEKNPKQTSTNFLGSGEVEQLEKKYLNGEKKQVAPAA